jgi:SP family myo-inositol transporter-like MFS transporter 13
MFAACGLMAISQLGGFNSILYYSGTLFATVGFNKPIAGGTIIAATNFVFTWINLLLVDRVGRRQILLHTLWLMAAALAVVAICFHWVPLSYNLELTSNKNGWAADIVLVCMVFFVAFYSAGAGNIAWMSSDFTRSKFAR